VSDAQAAAKRAAALEAAALVQSGMVLGLGSGSTARIAVDEIGRRMAAGGLRDIVAVPTSAATRELATAAGIPLTTLEQHPVLDLTIDGADEVDAGGDMIKGRGGALLWEKIVASASQRLVIVVDPSKVVELLGVTRALPVEVVPFGWSSHDATIRALGGVPALRRAGPAGTPVATDEDHYIIDCSFAGGITDPGAVHRALKQRPGVVETGLFLGFKPTVIVGKREAGSAKP
jgi:ribose 5-phosphate isomerase A